MGEFRAGSGPGGSEGRPAPRPLGISRADPRSSSRHGRSGTGDPERPRAVTEGPKCLNAAGSLAMNNHGCLPVVSLARNPSTSLLPPLLSPAPRPVPPFALLIGDAKCKCWPKFSPWHDLAHPSLGHPPSASSSEAFDCSDSHIYPSNAHVSLECCFQYSNGPLGAPLPPNLPQQIQAPPLSPSLLKPPLCYVLLDTGAAPGTPLKLVLVGWSR